MLYAPSILVRTYDYYTRKTYVFPRQPPRIDEAHPPIVAVEASVDVFEYQIRSLQQQGKGIRDDIRD